MPLRPILLALILAVPAGAAEPALDPALDRQRYDGCVRALETDAPIAERFGREWAERGGGLPARHCRALALMRMERFADAEAELADMARAAASGAFAADLWAQAGNAALLGGDAGKAAGHFEAGLGVVGAFAPLREAALRIDLARALVEMGRNAQARGALDRAVTLDPANATGWLLSAALARRQGDLARASHDIARASALAPSDPDVMLEQGHVAAAAGDREGAERVWALVLRAAPGSEAARLAARARAER